MELIIGNKYKFEFAGDLKIGILNDIKTLYDGAIVYVFNIENSNLNYPVTIKMIKDYAN